MFVLGIMLWRPRSRGVMWTGIGLAIGAGLTYAGLNLGQDQLVSQAPADFTGVLASVTTTMLRFLANALLVMLCLGIALAIAGWLAGATASGRKVRDAIAGAAHRWGSPLADGPVGRFTAEHPMLVPTVRALVIVLAAAYLVLVDRRSPSMILWTFGLMALGLLLVEIVEGAGRGYEENRAGALVADASTTVGIGPAVAGDAAPSSSQS
jgi:hypothetical protein